MISSVVPVKSPVTPGYFAFGFVPRTEFGPTLSGRFSAIGRTRLAHVASSGSAWPTSTNPNRPSVGGGGGGVAVSKVVVVGSFGSHATAGSWPCGTSRRVFLPSLALYRKRQLDAGVQSSGATSCGITVEYILVPVTLYSSQQPVSVLAPKLTVAPTPPIVPILAATMAIAIERFMSGTPLLSVRDVLGAWCSEESFGRHRRALE